MGKTCSRIPQCSDFAGWPIVNLLIVSHTEHYSDGKNIKGWGPTIRELSYLAFLFDQVVHIAPLQNGSPPSSSMPIFNRQCGLSPSSTIGWENHERQVENITAYTDLCFYNCARS